jgi:hypothetical protein
MPKAAGDRRRADDRRECRSVPTDRPINHHNRGKDAYDAGVGHTVPLQGLPTVEDSKKSQEASLFLLYSWGVRHT